MAWHSRLPRRGGKQRLRSRLGLGLADGFCDSRRRLRFEPLEERRLLAVAISEFPTPTDQHQVSSGVNGITTGADGNLWFTEQTQAVSGVPQPSRIGKFTLPNADHPHGDVQEYFIKNDDGVTNTGSAFPGGIAPGPSGELWFTEGRGNIVKFDPFTTDVTKQFKNYPIPGGGSPTALVVVSDQGLANLAIYFTDQRNNAIGKMAFDGTITEYAIPTASSTPYGIAEGPDGNIWFTELNGNKIGQMTLGGAITEFAIQHSRAQPEGITAGPDGCLWFTEQNSQIIGRITPAGIREGTVTIQEFTLFSGIDAPTGITTGPDHNLWFTEAAGNRIGRINPATEAIDEFDLPTAKNSPSGITLGSDGNMWFTETHYTPDPINPANGVYSGHVGQAIVPANTNPSVDVEITSDTPSAVKPGDPITIHLTVKNKDTQHPVSFTVYDPIPAGAGFSAGAGDYFQSDRGTADVTKGLGTVHIDNLETFGTAHITLHVTAGGVGQIVNRAYAVSDSRDPIPANNTVVTSVNVQPPVSTLVLGGLLVGDYSGTPMTFNNGTGTKGDFHFQLTYAGGDTPQSPVVTLTVPSSLDQTPNHIIAYPPNIFSATYDNITDTTKITYTWPTDPNSTDPNALKLGKTVTFGFMAVPKGPGDISVAASLTAVNQFGMGSKTSTAINTTVGQAKASAELTGALVDLTGNPTKTFMSIDPETGNVAAGGIFGWRLTNTGATTMTHVNISIPVSERLTHILPSAFIGSIFNTVGNPHYDSNTNLVTVSNVTLAKGQILNFGFAADPTSAGPVGETADVTIDQPLIGGGSLSKQIIAIVFSSLTHLANPRNVNDADLSEEEGGPPGRVISSADLVPIYYGKQWTQPGAGDNWPDVSDVPAQMDLAMGIIVGGPYMDFLSQYSTSQQTIGRGKIEADQNQMDSLAPPHFDDKDDSSAIKAIVKAQIGNTISTTGVMPSQDTIYVVYLPPKTTVTTKTGASINTLYAYHNIVSYAGSEFPYIVMPYAGYQNIISKGLTSLQTMTISLSHEIAEAVTDPDVRSGWASYDKNNGYQEIGDLELQKELQPEPEGVTSNYGTLDHILVQYEWANSYTFPGTNQTVMNQPVLPQDPNSTNLNLSDIAISLIAPAFADGASGESSGFSFSGLIAKIKDSSHPGNNPQIYTATIDWGDNTTSTGTVTYDANLQQFLISGSHNFMSVTGSKVAINVSLVDNANGDVASLTAAVALQQATATAGKVQFHQPTLEVSRNGSDAVITVDRVGDASLAATVDFHVSGGTAVNGTDYQAESGPLTFAPGATTATILLPIYSNPAATGHLTVNLALSTPTGNIVLGTQTTTVLTIHPSTDIFAPTAPTLDPHSDIGAKVNDGITADIGSFAAPLTFKVTGASVRNGFVQLLDMTDPDNPGLLGDPVQASNGAATITLKNGALTDGTHLVAVANSVAAGSRSSHASATLRVVLDSAAPTSKVATLPVRTLLTSLPVSWSGADNAIGTGIHAYNISVSIDGAAAIPWLTKTTLKSSAFPAALGHSYAFFASALDVAGNAEPAHAIADASVLVTAHPWHNSHTGRGLDVTDDGNIVAEDVLSVINYINSKGSGRLPDSVLTALPARFVDTDSDDNVAASDVIKVINYINALPRQSEAESEAESAAVSISAPDAYANAFQPDQATTGLMAAPVQPLAESATHTALRDLISLLALDIFSQQAKRRRV